ncbi:MAG TPA: C1 family peptidase [Labilithrix sp.]|nr:C1 family peptidase [Labilithrix sp.]
MKVHSAAIALLTCLVAAAACASPSDAPRTDESNITDVAHTPVERQSIGNCWLYAHASWAEAMHKAATGKTFDISQSYWTYWHWFDQITDVASDTLDTGGSWQMANYLVEKYGLMAEKDFISADTRSQMSARQAEALEEINRELESGELRTLTARRNKATVRRVLDRAWRLPASKVAMLDQVFGPRAERNFASRRSQADSSGTSIVRPDEFEAAYPRGPGAEPEARTLLDASRDWQEVSYRGNRRSVLTRVQRALHDAQPVVISWFVDFNAMENRPNERLGSFNLTTLREFGPGSQGGHMTVLEDYQAILSDGTVLEAGITLDPSKSKDQKLLDRALEVSTQIQFLRVKNSWGTARPDRGFAPGMPGYHDLYLDYLNGPIQECATDEDGETDTSNCRKRVTPLEDFVLPPGY